jgi:predicted transcriptional regulator/N-acetylglutamate synthase-like GNAT family acetyltransferase
MALSKQRRNETPGMLFPLATNFRIARLGQTQALQWTDDMGVLRDLVYGSEKMYPEIRHWFNDKVVPGLKSERRIAWVAYESEQAIASAVLKLGPNSKFCHLKIHQDFQDMALGQMFFSQMAAEARHDAQEIHFTLPESLWVERHGFFESFGFSNARKAGKQYRRGETELACSAPFETVWSSVLSRLRLLARKFSVGGYSLDGRILISIKPKYAGRILAGAKLVEVRKRFSNKWVGCRAVLYASTPLKALVGEATIMSVTSGPPADIWTQFGQALGCNAHEFEAYTGSASQVSAVELGDIIPYREPIGLAQASYLVREDLIPPQSFCDLRLDGGDNPWVKAVSVASLLHGRFNFVERPQCRPSNLG